MILNMDESAIYLDAPSNYSYTEKGSKRVKASTTGSERVRLSTAFTASACGKKLPVYTMIPRVTPLPRIFEFEYIVPCYQTKTCFDKSSIIDYLSRVIMPYKTTKALNRVLLILDQATCHKSEDVAKFCIDHFIDLVFIPGRMTNLLQPADVSWFGVIKKSYKKLWSEW